MTGINIFSESSGSAIANDMNGNPSPRRDGIQINFKCEGCASAGLTMNIVQHKGSTFFEWDAV